MKLLHFIPVQALHHGVTGRVKLDEVYRMLSQVTLGTELVLSRHELLVVVVCVFDASKE